MAEAGKLDFKTVMGPLWRPKAGRFEIVEVPQFAFAMVDGQGDPDGADFARATSWLYAVSYGLKFASKAEGRDYGVGPLEALWWADDMDDFLTAARERWRWTGMIVQPDWITPDLFAAAIAKAASKLGAPPETLRLERFAEGLCVQTLHIGPYSAEAPVIARLHQEFLPQNGLVPTGHHHEIYFSDPRRAAPEKLRTLLRQPVARAA